MFEISTGLNVYEPDNLLNGDIFHMNIQQINIWGKYFKFGKYLSKSSAIYLQSNLWWVKIGHLVVGVFVFLEKMHRKVFFRCSFFAVKQSEERTLSLKWQRVRQARLCPTRVYFSKVYTFPFLYSKLCFKRMIYQSVFFKNKFLGSGNTSVKPDFA